MMSHCAKDDLLTSQQPVKFSDSDSEIKNKTLTLTYFHVDMRETQQKVQRIRRTEQRSPSFLVNRESILHSVISGFGLLRLPREISGSLADNGSTMFLSSVSNCVC